MPNFDIEKLLDFQPPRYRCVKCLALWIDLPLPEYTGGRLGAPIKCPQCRVEYSPTEYCRREEFREFLIHSGCSIEVRGLFEHARQVGQIARHLRVPAEPYTLSWEWHFPYLKGLLQAFTLARSFVHFTSFGLSPFMLGALKLAAQRVYINGVVSTNASYVVKLLTSDIDNADEARNLELRVLAAEGNGRDLPHQKIVVIDGLIAFKGSINLTEMAWRKAEQNLEEVEVISDVAEVIALNNRFFSSAWTRADKTSGSNIVDMKLGEPPWLGLELSPQ